MSHKGATAVVLFILASGFYVMTAQGGNSLLAAVQGWKTEQQITALMMARHAYQATHGALPGDDPRAPRSWGRPEPETGIALIGNGRLDGGPFAVHRPDGEPFAAWRDLRFAGLLDGDPALTGLAAAPRHPFGGFFGWGGGVLGFDEALCLSSVPETWAADHDRRRDDGDGRSGRIRHAPAAEALPGNGWVARAGRYMLCIKV